MDKETLQHVVFPAVLVALSLSVNASALSVVGNDDVDTVGRKVTHLSGRITALERAIGACVLHEVP